MSKMIGAPNIVVSSDDLTAIPVASDAVVYTKAFKIGGGSAFGIFVKANSSVGTPDIKVELQQSYVLPGTEGAADDNWVEPDGYNDIFQQIKDELAHIDVVHPIPMPLGRYKITGNEANPADTTVNIVNFIQEQT